MTKTAPEAKALVGALEEIATGSRGCKLRHLKKAARYQLKAAKHTAKAQVCGWWPRGALRTLWPWTFLAALAAGCMAALTAQEPPHTQALKCDDWWISGEEYVTSVSAEALSLCLAAGADVNARDYRGNTRLHFAAWYNAEAVPILIEAGADVNARDDRSNTPLHFAAQNNAEAVPILIEAGADVNMRNDDGNTPLHSAVQNPEALEAVPALIEAGADVNAWNDDGNMPLHSAASRGTPEAVLALIEAGADVNALSLNSAAPLNMAAYSPKRAAALVARGAKSLYELEIDNALAACSLPAEEAIAVTVTSLLSDGDMWKGCGPWRWDGWGRGRQPPNDTSWGLCSLFDHSERRVLSYLSGVGGISSLPESQVPVEFPNARYACTMDAVAHPSKDAQGGNSLAMVLGRHRIVGLRIHGLGFRLDPRRDVDLRDFLIFLKPQPPPPLRR